MLQTDASWEITDNKHVLSALSGQPGVRRYHMFELALNVPIYRVEVLFANHREGEQSLLRRYRFDDLEKAVALISRTSSRIIRLVQEPRFDESKKAELREISAVFTALNEHGDKVLAIDTDHGRFRVSFALDEAEGVLSHIRRIWPPAEDHDAS